MSLIVIAKGTRVCTRAHGEGTMLGVQVVSRRSLEVYVFEHFARCERITVCGMEEH